MDLKTDTGGFLFFRVDEGKIADVDRHDLVYDSAFAAFTGSALVLLAHINAAYVYAILIAVKTVNLASVPFGPTGDHDYFIAFS